MAWCQNVFDDGAVTPSGEASMIFWISSSVLIAFRIFPSFGQA
jgi:hypothetical protein